MREKKTHAHIKEVKKVTVYVTINYVITIILLLTYLRISSTDAKHDLSKSANEVCPHRYLAAVSVTARTARSESCVYYE